MVLSPLSMSGLEAFREVPTKNVGIKESKVPCEEIFVHVLNFQTALQLPKDHANQKYSLLFQSNARSTETWVLDDQLGPCTCKWRWGLNNQSFTHKRMAIKQVVKQKLVFLTLTTAGQGPCQSIEAVRPGRHCWVQGSTHFKVANEGSKHFLCKECGEGPPSPFQDQQHGCSNPTFFSDFW